MNEPQPPNADSPLTPEILELIRGSAEQGNVEAQYRLAMMYANQDGVPLDYSQAVYWLQSAAAQEYVPAYGVLGWLHANGYGTAQDGEAAATWYLRSAEAGVAESQYLVASMYRIGSNGLPRDAALMLDWYRRAAEQQFAPAQNMLGKLMAKGKLIRQDLVGAFQWFSLAILNGSEDAREGLDALRTQMEPEQAEEARTVFLQAMRAQGVDVGALDGGGDGGGAGGHML